MSEEKEIIEDEEMFNPAPEGVNETSNTTAVKKYAKNKNPKKEEKKKMSMKSELEKIGLSLMENTRIPKDKWRYGFNRAKLSELVMLCQGEKNLDNIMTLVNFTVNKNLFLDEVKRLRPNLDVEKYRTVKVESKDNGKKRNGIDSIFATVKKRFASADGELLDNLQALLKNIKASHESNKPKKAKFTKSLKDRLAKLNKDELFAYVESLKNSEN